MDSNIIIDMTKLTPLTETKYYYTINSLGLNYPLAGTTINKIEDAQLLPDDNYLEIKYETGKKVFVHIYRVMENNNVITAFGRKQVTVSGIEIINPVAMDLYVYLLCQKKMVMSIIILLL